MFCRTGCNLQGEGRGVIVFMVYGVLVHEGGSTGAWLLLSFLLLRTRCLRYLMMIWWMSFVSF